MRTRTRALTGLAAAVLVGTTGTAYAATQVRHPAPGKAIRSSAHGSGQSIVDWNRELIMPTPAVIPSPGNLKTCRVSPTQRRPAHDLAGARHERRSRQVLRRTSRPTDQPGHISVCTRTTVILLYEVPQ